MKKIFFIMTIMTTLAVISSVQIYAQDSKTVTPPADSTTTQTKSADEKAPTDGQPPDDGKQHGAVVCGDGVCDKFEKANDRCEQDCGKPVQDPLDSSKIPCGDGECTEYEKRNNTCPLDCNLTDY